MNDSLFEDGNASDPLYEFYRDTLSQVEFKKKLEAMWQSYKPFNPDGDNFKNQTKRHFHAMTWQMYVADALRLSGFNLRKPPAEGPDIQFEKEGKVFWIEAVSAGLGSTGDKVIPVLPHSGTIIEEPILLRITNVIDEKLKKIKKYIEKKIIDPKDPVIIAVTTSEIEDSKIGDENVSYIEKVLFPIDKLSWRADMNTGENGLVSYGFRNGVQKLNGAVIPTGGFLLNSMPELSAVMWSPWDIINTLDKKGADITTVHNLIPNNPILPATFKFGTELVPTVSIAKNVYS